MDINPDVELEDDQIEKHSLEELIAQQNDVDTSVAHSGIDINDPSDLHTDDTPISKDRDHIRSIGISMFGVDATDPDVKALERAISQTNNDSIDKAFTAHTTDEDVVASALTAGIGENPSSLSKSTDGDLSSLTTEEQAIALVEDVRSNLDLLAKTEAYAKSNSPPEKIEEITYENIYSVVKNYCETVHPSNSLEKTAVTVVADQIAQHCSTLARIRA